MFSVPIIHYKIGNWEVNKKIIMDALPPESPDNFEEEGGLYTDFFKNADKDSKKLPPYGETIVNIIKPYLADFTDQRRVEFTDMWYQYQNPGIDHGCHNHGHSGWSSVIYVEFDPVVHQGTQFYSPFNNPWNGNLELYIPPVDEGSMVIFPSTIIHESLKNHSDKRRTIVSYNLRGHVDVVKYELWQGDPIVKRMVPRD